MKIIVCIKQVPALADTPMDAEKGVLLRTGENKINPYDLPALETALKIRDVFGGTVTALTMGPESSEQALRTALAMTVDSACLMTDKAFAGADVLITAKTLAQGIGALGGADLIICGQQTTDGDTAQVPFSLAEQMGIPVMGWIRRIDGIVGEKVIAEQELTGFTCQVEAEMPLVLAVNPSIAEARVPGLRAKLKASKMPIERLSIKALLDTDPDHYGLSASPTRVFRLFGQQSKAKHPPVKADGDTALAMILEAVQNAREQL